MKNLLIFLLLSPALLFGQKAAIYNGKAFSYGGKIMSDTVVSAAVVDGSVGTSIDNTTNVDCGVLALWHSKFESTSAGTISYAHLYVTDGNNAKACLSIHNVSGTCLASGEVADIGNGTAWVTVALDSPIEIAASTSYYLGFQVDIEIYIGRHYVEAVTGERFYDGTYTYSCGGNVHAEESTGTGGDREITIIFNNSPNDPS